MTTTWPAAVNNGVTTSWIPFVTPGFSVLPSCSAQMYIVPGSSPIVAFDPWQQINIEWQLQCLPAEVIEYWSQSQSAHPTLTSRLGPMHCPSMYTTASTSVSNEISTSVICCPSEYGLLPGTSQLCISTLTAGSIAPESLVVSGGKWISWTPSTITSVGATITGANVNGYIFGTSTPTAVLQGGNTAATTSSPSNLPSSTSTLSPSSSKSSTLPSVGTTTSSPSATFQSSSSTTSSSSEASVSSTLATISGLVTTIYSTINPASLTTASSSPTALPGSTSLSTGAKAGISVACAVGAIGIAILAVILALMRRRRKEILPVLYYEKDASGRDGSERGIVPKETNLLTVNRAEELEVGRINADMDSDSRDRQARNLAAYQDAVPPSFLGGGFQNGEDGYADENGGRGRVKPPVREIYTDHHPHELDGGIRH